MVWNSIPVLMMAVITAYIAIYHLLKFLLQKKSLEDLYFALLCLSVFLYDLFSIGLYNSTAVSGSILWQRGQLFSVALIATCTVLFIYRITETRADALCYCLAATYGLLGLLALLPFDFVLYAERPLRRSFRLFSLTVSYLEARPGPLVGVLFVLIVAGMFFGYRLLVRKRALPLIIAFTLFFLTDIADMLNAFGLLKLVYLIEYSFLGLVLVMEHSLLRRFVEMNAQVASLNLLLEQRVADRTRRIEILLEQLSQKNGELEEKNSRLQEIAERDSLTELLNHAAFHRRLREVFNESRRNRFSFAVLMFDVDSFKKLNDSFGHLVGDAVLKRIAEVLHGQAEGDDNLLRNYDVASRYGGDEFALILPYCGQAEAEAVCGRVLASIRAVRLAEHPELRVTVSLGGTILSSGEECAHERFLIMTADRGLYRAKMEGKDCHRLAAYAGSEQAPAS
jgi:diguanylate cyclase (GGDEF)-like protein